MTKGANCVEMKKVSSLLDAKLAVNRLTNNLNSMHTFAYLPFRKRPTMTTKDELKEEKQWCIKKVQTPTKTNCLMASKMVSYG